MYMCRVYMYTYVYVYTKTYSILCRTKSTSVFSRERMSTNFLNKKKKKKHKKRKGRDVACCQVYVVFNFTGFSFTLG